MKHCLCAIVLLAVLLPVQLWAQTDTVDVPDFYQSGTEGTLNDAVTTAISGGTLSNTVFRLRPGLYVLSATITVPMGQRLTLYAPDPGNSQATAPPMICWTPSSGVSTTFNFDCYGDVYMTNIWILYATTNTVSPGTQVGSALEIDEDTTDHRNVGVFKNCMFDYAPISNGGGAITVSASHANLTFDNCYWRNCIDTHFRYYGRVLSFPFGTQGWHIDKVSFTNCTFANQGYVLMEEGAEYADSISFNHCDFLNTMMYNFEAGWWHWLSITNSIFENAYMFGYFADSTQVLPTNPDGGTINIDSVATWGFTINWPNDAPLTDDGQRHILFANNSYYIEQWLANYMTPFNATTNPTGGNRYSDSVGAINPTLAPHPTPLMNDRTLTFFNNHTAFPYMTMQNVYDSTNPGFLLPPTNQVGIKSYLYRKWFDNSDTTWAFHPENDINQSWPNSENLGYTNNTLKTAAMGGFPLGDLFHWQSASTYNNWKSQRETEEANIFGLLQSGATAVGQNTSNVPAAYSLSQNFPNPFNPTTQINYAVPQKSHLSLKVYNLLGQEVATLFDGDRQAGHYTATFDASNLTTGVYFYRLKADNYTITRKLILMK